MKASEERKLKRNELVRKAIRAKSKEIIAQRSEGQADESEKEEKPRRKRKAE